MLTANNKFCQAGVEKHCQKKPNLWGYKNNLIVHIGKIKDGHASGQIITLNPKNSAVVTVSWPNDLFYHDGFWWDKAIKLPISLAPADFKYSALAKADQPTGFSLQLSLVFAAVGAILLAFFSWACLADEQKLSNMVEYLFRH